MRLFVDARMSGHSGIGVALHEILRSWRRNPPGFPVTLLGAGDGERDLAEGWAQCRPWHAPIYSLAAAMRPFRTFGARRGDVAFSPHYATSLVADIPMVCAVNDLLHLTHPPRRGTSLFLRGYLAALRRTASFIVTPSRLVKVQLQTLHRFEAHRVLTIPYGPGQVAFPSEAPAPRGPAAPLMAVGLYKPHKNWDFLLDRLAGMWSRGELARPLVAIGLGRDRGAFEARVQALGVADRVETHGHLSVGRLAVEYARARALLFPSLAEGFGLPILEAMGSGTPVLIADRSPMIELAQGAAITFDPDRPDTFDAAVRALDRNDTLNTELIARGREVAARYSWDRTAARIADAVRRCTGKR